MEIKGKVWEVHKGIVEEVIIDEQVFIPKQAPGEQPEPEAKQEKTKTTVAKRKPMSKPTEQIDLGPIIGYANGQAIHKYVATDIEQKIKQNLSYEELINEFKYWHPGTKRATRMVYLSAYRKYLSREQNKPGRIGNRDDLVNEIANVGISMRVLDRVQKEPDNLVSILQDEHPDVKASTIKKYVSCYRRHIKDHGYSASPSFHTKKKGKKRKKYNRKKPVGAIGYDKTYKTWIKEDNYALVIRALRKYGFKATSKNIAKETRLSVHRVNAILHWMIDHKKAYKNYDKETFEPVYYPEDGKETKVSFP